MNTLPKDLLDRTVETTLRAGEAVMNYYHDAFEVRDKNPDNPVTDADLAADRLLKEQLMALLPEAGWLSEESVDDYQRLESDYCWVVDPLDGTKEFVLGIPEFTISIGLVKGGSPIIGVVHNPATGELMLGQRSRGILINGQPAGVSKRAKFLGSRVDASRSERKRGEFLPFEELVELRTVGSIAYKLARVAVGQSDISWSRGPKHEWDICAGLLLVQEGGGRCGDLDDQPIVFNKPWPKVNGIIASNGLLHQKTLEALAPHRNSARVD